MDRDSLVVFATAMFTILNPIGNIAIFASLVAGRPAAARRNVAIRCAVAVAVILVLTVWAGESTLRLFGVELPSLQVAGGVMIASIALSMLHSRQSAIHDTKDNDATPVEYDDTDIAVVPLAIPMVAGPGAIVTVIVNTHQYSGVEAYLAMSAICVALAVIVCIGFLSSGPISRVLGAKGMDIVTKIMGMVLLAIAAGMFAAGAKGLLPGLGLT